MDNSLISLNDTMALRILRACPKAAASMNLSGSQNRALCDFRLELAVNSRKPLQISRMNTPCMSCHERCILNGLASVQNDDETGLEKTLEWLVPRWAKASVRDHFQTIARMLDSHNIRLSPYRLKAPVRREQAGLYAVIGSKVGAL